MKGYEFSLYQGSFHMTTFQSELKMCLFKNHIILRKFDFKFFLKILLTWCEALMCTM